MSNRYRKDEFIFKEPSEQGADGTKKNWYALAVSILANKSVSDGLKAMGLCRNKKPEIHTLGEEPISKCLCYIMYRVCGLSDDKIGDLLRIPGRSFSYKAKAYKKELEENQWLE